MRKTVFFIGIGGVSMSGFAEMLHMEGHAVSGSDKADSPAVGRLRKLGIPVYPGHDPKYVLAAGKPDLVVYTGAVPHDSPDLEFARGLGVPVLERAEYLGDLMRGYRHPVCVSGTHGKTTATSMVTEIFLKAGCNPTVSVGGHLDSIGGNYLIGGKDYFIAEADEYHGSFLNFYPRVGVILNIDLDHLDYYRDLGAVRRAFRRFAENIPEGGTLVINSGIERLGEFTDGLVCGLTTFGDGGDVSAAGVTADGSGFPGFTLAYRGEELGFVKLRVRGLHNVANGLAACGAATALGVPADAVINGLSSFVGVRRRFEYKGETGGLHVVDDYAHHPNEIRATLKAARAAGYERVICAFQPHTYTRTAGLMDDFASCFDDADIVLLLDIYAAREQNEGNVSSAQLAEKILLRGRHGSNVFYCEDILAAMKIVEKNYMRNDLFITMGAGDIYLLADHILSTGL